ncbi:MAG: ABC transporter ATP-binding protein/permease [Verrucomicrobia bacterium]|nr:ABC transporter ATP-binding protein/permease [Verrucomicrobiota bacterium]
MKPPPPASSGLPNLWRMLRYFWPRLQKHRWLIAVSLAALFAEVGIRLLEPWPLKFVFDGVLRFGRKHHAGVAWANGTFSASEGLILAAVALVVITASRAVAAYWQTIWFAQIGRRVIAQLREQLYRHLQYLSLSFHTKARTGDLVIRLMNDISMLQDVAVTALLPLSARALIVVAMILLMFWLNWQLALAAIAVFPLFCLLSLTLGRRIQHVAQRQRRQEGALAARAAESISAIKTVQAFSLESAFAREVAAQSEKSLRQDVQGRRLAASLERSVDVLVAIASALVLWRGATLVLDGQITAGDLLVFLAYLKTAYRPVQDFAKYAARLAKASAAGERVLELLDRVPEVRDLPNAISAPPLQGQVEFRGVTFAYERGRRLLRQVDLQITPGQQVVIVGPSGGGKSTLVSLILRLYDPQEGAVCIDGHDVRHFTLESLRSQISVVLQDHVLFAVSVSDNIAAGAPGAGRAEIEAAARLANAHEFITALPQGYDTVVGERGLTLSQGQRQRLAIARAAIRRAPILILDEPTIGLDKQNERAVLEAIQRLYHGRTTFLITHDLRQATRADAVLYVERGRLREQGTHDALVQAGGRYAALWRLNSGSPETPTEPKTYAMAQ